MYDDATKPMHDRPLPIPYTADEVGRTFSDLLATFDFGLELHELGIGSLSVFKRRQAKKRFTALCIALWHVAVEKSFPHDAEIFFTHFITTYPPLCGNGGSAKQLRDFVSKYDALVSEKKDADFSHVADNLAESLRLAKTERPKQQLKLSLRIRAMYDLIFAKLI
ncbi:hypothetical protein FACS1894206_04460 [Deltaproteobacteria bacterium]|nr:hypothetical protein FACS1894206_04460 [Deltaproteobacteria bacterium]